MWKISTRVWSLCLQTQLPLYDPRDKDSNNYMFPIMNSLVATTALKWSLSSFFQCLIKSYLSGLDVIHNSTWRWVELTNVITFDITFYVCPTYMGRTIMKLCMLYKYKIVCIKFKSFILIISNPDVINIILPTWSVLLDDLTWPGSEKKTNNFCICLLIHVVL